MDLVTLTSAVRVCIATRQWRPAVQLFTGQALSLERGGELLALYRPGAPTCAINGQCAAGFVVQKMQESNGLQGQMACSGKRVQPQTLNQFFF